MNWIVNSCTVILVLTFTWSCKKKKADAEVVPQIITSSVTSFGDRGLIEAHELISMETTKNIKIIDFRKEAAYEEGHLPESIRIWRDDIENPNYPYKGMMASKETVEALFSKLGIENDDTLVIYDKHGSYDATRLWWILQNYDFTSVKILDGGINAWTEAGGQLTNEITKERISKFVLPAESSMRYIIDLKTLQGELTKVNPPLMLDVRTSDEHTGKRLKSGAKRAGHIPNSILIDWANSVEYHGFGKFRSLQELENIYKKMGISKEDPIVTYCHTGVRSAHTTFVLTQLLGYKNVKNYDGSWSEWSFHEDLPIERDSITTILQ